MEDERIEAAENYEAVNSKLTYEECLSFHRYMCRDALIYYITTGCIIAVIAAIALLLGDTEPYIIGGIIACIGVGVYRVITIFHGAKKKADETEKGYTPCVKTEWRVFADYFEFKQLRGDKEEYSVRINPSEIKNVTVLDDMYLFSYGNMTWCIAKRMAKEGSTLFKLLFPSGVAVSRKTMSATVVKVYDLLDTITWIVLLVSLCLRKIFLNCMWLLPLFSVFPVAALALSLFAKRKGIKISEVTGKNIFCVMAIVCLLYFAF